MKQVYILIFFWVITSSLTAQNTTHQLDSVRDQYILKLVKLNTRKYDDAKRLTFYKPFDTKESLHFKKLMMYKIKNIKIVQFTNQPFLIEQDSSSVGATAFFIKLKDKKLDGKHEEDYMSESEAPTFYHWSINKDILTFVFMDASLNQKLNYSIP